MEQRRNYILHTSNEMAVDRKGKVSVFLPSLTGGGAERSMLNLAQGLAQCGCTVDLVLAQARGPYLNDVDNTIRLVDLKASRVLASLPALVHYLRHEQPIALISALNYANVVILWARRLAGVPTRVLVNEQNTISRSAHNSAQWRQRMVPYLVRHFYPWADYVVGNSRGVVDDLIQVTGLPPERIKLLYNPVVTPAVQKKARMHLNHPWFEPGQPPVILAVGRLTKQKDFPTLIRAFAQLLQTRPARLIILGEGLDRQVLEAMVKQLGVDNNVAMPGFVENPYAYMSRAALYVLSSQWEGLPTVLIEALYCGSPIVATDCPSGSREILANGKYGVLVPVGDVACLTKAMEAGLEGKTPRPTEESWRPYSLEVVANQYIGLLLDSRAK
jgi:glycosyltransferase involved in cell wall biosynthesis